MKMKIAAVTSINQYWAFSLIQGGSNMTGTDLCVNKPHSCCAVRLVYTKISPGHIWTTLYIDLPTSNAIPNICFSQINRQFLPQNFHIYPLKYFNSVFSNTNTLPVYKQHLLFLRLWDNLNCVWTHSNSSHEIQLLSQLAQICFY